MKIIVTGASGFIGTNLVKYLKAKNHFVSVICDQTCESSDIADYAFYTGLLGFKEKYFNIKQADALIHLAANNDTLDNNTKQMINQNFLASKKMYKFAKKLNCSHFIYASSMAVYGNKINEEDPLNTYATSKLMFDNFVKRIATQEKMKLIGLRFCNVYGPHEEKKGRRMSYLGQMLRNMILNKKVKLYKETNTKRDWVYVEDVCEVIELCLSSNLSEIYNIGSGKTISFIELFKKLALITGYDKLPILIENDHINSYQNIDTNDISKAVQELGYNPKFTFDLGIQKYFDQIKSNYLAIS